MASDIKLGDRARDKITGFEGIVIARTDWLYNCVRFVIQPSALNKDGKPIESESFDEDQLELVVPEAAVEKQTKTGGPMPEPERR
jgi:hypothetical protein